MKIAFIGLGKMGTGMASCLLHTGHALQVWNRTISKAQPLVNSSATLAETPEKAVAGAGVIFSSLMDDDSVQSLFHAGASTFEAMPEGAVHVCLTTISPDCADRLQREHQAAGRHFVSGPVFGRPDMAATGKLLQLLSGESQAVELVKPICAAFAPQSIVIRGSAGAANLQKLCMNFAIIAFIEAMAESFQFAEQSGASRDGILHLFDQVFSHPGLKQYAHRLHQKNTSGEGGFTMTAGLKDVTMMRNEARQHGLRLDLADIISEKMQRAIELGMGNDDWSAIQQVQRMSA